MTYAFSIITPAFGAKATILRAARSVLAQTHQEWEWIIVVDDQCDYGAILDRDGINDPRIRFLSTGAEGSGSPPARNIGLDAARNRHIAILDADDLFHPEKLAYVAALLPNHALFSCALAVVDDNLSPLRFVGKGPDRLLPASEYKFTNLSMDSMLVYDRHKTDPRFNPDFPCLTDIEFLLKLFAKHEACFHLGSALHTYVKQPQSISNKAGASTQIADTKRRLLALLQQDAYPLADPKGKSGMLNFYQLSLTAELNYESLLTERPGLLFEDHLEPLLRAAASTASTASTSGP